MKELKLDLGLNQWNSDLVKHKGKREWMFKSQIRWVGCRSPEPKDNPVSRLHSKPGVFTLLAHPRQIRALGFRLCSQLGEAVNRIGVDETSSEGEAVIPIRTANPFPRARNVIWLALSMRHLAQSGAVKRWQMRG